MRRKFGLGQSQRKLGWPRVDKVHDLQFDPSFDGLQGQGRLPAAGQFDINFRQQLGVEQGPVLFAT